MEIQRQQRKPGHCCSPRAHHCAQYIIRVSRGGQEKIKCKIKVYWHHRTSLSSPRMVSTSHTFICSPCIQQVLWRAYYVKAVASDEVYATHCLLHVLMGGSRSHLLPPQSRLRGSDRQTDCRLCLALHWLFIKPAKVQHD